MRSSHVVLEQVDIAFDDEGGGRLGRAAARHAGRAAGDRAGSRPVGHWVTAASTVGTWLRSFTFGHVRQRDRVCDEILSRAWAAGAGPDDGPLTGDEPWDLDVLPPYALGRRSPRRSYAVPGRGAGGGQGKLTPPVLRPVGPSSTSSTSCAGRSLRRSPTRSRAPTPWLATGSATRPAKPPPRDHAKARSGRSAPGRVEQERSQHEPEDRGDDARRHRP
jgi:hypothetical protein